MKSSKDPVRDILEVWANGDRDLDLLMESIKGDSDASTAAILGRILNNSTAMVGILAQIYKKLDSK